MKRLVLFGIMLLIGLFIVAVPAMADEKGESLTDATLIPLMPFFLNIGGDIYWNPTEQEITITRYDKEVVLKMNSREALVKGAKRSLKNSVQLIAGQVFAPVELLGIFADKLTLSKTHIISTFSYR
ncbi:MAG: copper amine oxidase N-terminal domain-containing protein [Bacillota bacterium]